VVVDVRVETAAMLLIVDNKESSLSYDRPSSVAYDKRTVAVLLAMPAATVDSSVGFTVRAARDEIQLTTSDSLISVDAVEL
jgi:hypothetical protein